ncbi:asparaginase domain-containing protein [Paenibacillus algorifonticola]|uniref:asparaginase n=1 Tax=Paenibacillus algorifonticola TaxID=684063 RepID=UPI003D29B80D
MSNLLVIFTGGTIGSKSGAGAISVREAGSYAIIEGYQSSPRCRESVKLECAQPLNILSENLVPDDWNVLIETIRSADLSRYNGIIVTHGSDTLAYSAAMLSYIFCDSPIPIVLVASNYPLGDPRSNGLRNFASAVEFIDGEKLKGVYVVYENSAGEAIVYLGTRVTQAVSFTDQLECPYDVHYGIMSEGKLIVNQHSYNPPVQELRSRKPSPSPFTAGKDKLQSGLLYVKPFSGMTYDYFDFGQKAPKAVVHDLFHSGTANTSASERHSLLAFAKYCAEHSVDLYLCPLKDSSETLYASSVALQQAGVSFIENMSVDAALMKLTLAYSLYTDKQQLREFVMNTPLFYEFVASR